MSKAFTYPIGLKNSGAGELGAVHQSSPAWVLTFVRWEFRDTLRTPNNAPFTVRKPLVVENDCISITTNMNKGVLTPSMQATLLLTDVDYEVETEPGDFVIVNILNWPQDARRVANQARAGQPINGINDGFKGIYKIQGVRRTINTDPNTGVKTVVFKINGFAFTEFNNTIYFNPNLVNQKNLQNQALFISDISTAWKSMVSKAGVPYIQEIIAFLIQSFIGNANDPNSKKAEGLAVSPNTHFLIPTLVGRLLGVTNSKEENSKKFKTAQAAKDVYLYLFGIQQYSSGSTHTTLAQGMNPANLTGKTQYPGFNYTDTPCQGNSILKPEYWNQVKMWSILNQYTNAPLNELYTCFRIAPQGSRIMPTVVFRQIPFTSEDFATQHFGAKDSTANSIKVTKFLNLPRWKLGSESVISADLGRDEAARINFVQYYAKSNFSSKGIDASGETSNGNYVFDKNDVQRSGLRPYIVQNQFDDLPGPLILAAPVWARILGDALIGGHLKINGTLTCAGIVEPITVGDNLEFNNVVYHIEQVSHICTIAPTTGIKSFRTTLSLSYGIGVNSNTKGTQYADMYYGDGYKERINDYNNQQILPGVAEGQDTVYRPNTVDQPVGGGNPFPQPTTTPNKIKKG